MSMARDSVTFSRCRTKSREGKGGAADAPVAGVRIGDTDRERNNTIYMGDYEMVRRGVHTVIILIFLACCPS